MLFEITFINSTEIKQIDEGRVVQYEMGFCVLQGTPTWRLHTEAL